MAHLFAFDNPPKIGQTHTMLIFILFLKKHYYIVNKNKRTLFAYSIINTSIDGKSSNGISLCKLLRFVSSSHIGSS